MQMNEKLTNGELSEGEYYVETKDGEYTSMYLGSDEYSKRSVRCKKLKILEPVPTYEEHMMTKDCAKRLFEAAERETKLKMLLKECRELMDSTNVMNIDVYRQRKKDVLNAISQALGEDK